VRVDESNTITTSYSSTQSRDQIGPSYDTLVQCKLGHRRGMCNCDDAHQVSVSSARHADAGKRRDTGANSSRPDTCVIDVPQYEKLFQCIKHQKTKLHSCTKPIDSKIIYLLVHLNIFIVVINHQLILAFYCVPVSSKANTQERSDLCQCTQKGAGTRFQ